MKNILINGEITCIYGPEKSILLKGQFFSNQSIDSIES